MQWNAGGDLSDQIYIIFKEKVFGDFLCDFVSSYHRTMENQNFEVSFFMLSPDFWQYVNLILDNFMQIVLIASV